MSEIVSQNLLKKNITRVLFSTNVKLSTVYSLVLVAVDLGISQIALRVLLPSH